MQKALYPNKEGNGQEDAFYFFHLNLLALHHFSVKDIAEVINICHTPTS